MQTVTPAFTNFAEGQIRPLSWALRMSFDKTYDDLITFFTLDTSLLDGPDILSTLEDNPIQSWDYYQYLPYTDRVQFAEWTREIEFPYSVSSAMADIALENTDDYFTPNSGSPISSFILPKRPIRILSGFNNDNIPQFVGLTEKMPVIDDTSKVVTFHAMDFLSQMYTMPTTETIAMQDVRTDEVLAALFTQFGLAPSQYSLDVGSNVIPFLFYEKDSSAGQVFRDLMQAEMGNLWLDEAGIIRFSSRYASLPSPVYSFTEANTVSIKTTSDENIVNIVKINSSVRELQSFQSIWSLAENGLEPIVVSANDTKVVNISLEDPCVSVTQPTIGASSVTSWFTAIKTSDSTPVSTNVSITGDSLKTNTYTLFFSNTNAFDVTIDSMEVWGEPAKVIDTISYKEINQTSIDKYGEKLLEINNNLIQSESQCDSLALPILQSFSEYAGQIEIEVKGNPALQLNDIVSVNVKSYSGNYRITKTVNKLRDSKYTQVLTCVSTTMINWFILDSSLLDGPDVLVI